MQRTHSTGSTSGNLFTDGDPTTGTPATIVDAPWLNDVQEEICSVILAAGITLDTTDSVNNQMLAAINFLVQNGAAPSTTKFSLVNNQSSPLSFSGLIFDHTKYKAVRILYDVNIETSTTELNETGALWLTWKPTAGVWAIESQSFFDESGITFSVTTSGQIQYVSTNIGGTSYVGYLRINNVQLINL